MRSWLELPETKYVTVGGSQVAYQVVGNGPIDIALCYSLGGQVDEWWQIPQFAAFLTKIASVSRLIMFDRRGSGASDPLPLAAIPTWEELAEDLTAVLDATRSEITSVFAALDTGPLAILFAAMHPERVRSLVLSNTTARYTQAEDYSQGVALEALEGLIELVTQAWGTEDLVRLALPSLADDRGFTFPFAKMMRASATPSTAAAQFDYFLRHVDVRRVLDLVRTPTIVFGARDNVFFPPAQTRYISEHIPGAKYVEVPTGDLLLIDDDVVADTVEFLTGERPMTEVDRILTTVVFTDIVGSTERAAALGDKRWKSLLDAHDRLVREQLHRFRGKEIKATGDGFLASFDGPARAIRCARAINEATATLDLSVRAGVHTGECELRGDDLGGISVHIAARVGALAGPSEVLVSGTVKDLVAGSDITFDERGEHELKGVPGTWKLFAVMG